MTLAPSDAAATDAILSGMDEPTLIKESTFEAYLYHGYTIQHSDQPGYEERWFVYRERRPFRAFLKNPDQKLITFGALDEAVAWLERNPDALPELGECRP